jgi:hypothetical protein
MKKTDLQKTDELQNNLSRETLLILAKDKKTLDDWVEMELAKLKQKEEVKLK